jgi:hypothetical protein
MPRLHPDSLSPDPLYGRDLVARPIFDGAEAGMCVFRLRPWRVADAEDARGLDAAEERDPWAEQPPLELVPHPLRGARVLVDFGTEIEARLELAVEAENDANIYVSWGESAAEAQAWGLPPSPSNGFPPAKEHWAVPAGASRRAFDARGFRFARIDVFDAKARVSVAAEAVLAGGERRGDFRCDDPLFQRLWQTSLYTARACTRPRAFWDGIKRDRHGWYGDARVTQRTLDAAFSEPAPAEGMLLAWPDQGWANGIPAFSFDACAMFRQLLLAHGTARLAARDIYERMRGFLGWVLGSQVDDRLRLVRREGVEYFFGIGFVDWSPQPLGGRFEELPWLQCAWCEALGHAAVVAGWLGREDDRAAWSSARDRLAKLIARDLWRDGGFPHTLERATATEDWAMPLTPDVHRRLSYDEKKRFGPSRPSRHAAARGALADVLDAPMRASTLRMLDDPSIPGIITPFYQFYEQWARATCGDPAGALRRMVDYLEAMLVPNDGATVWESFEPQVRGFGRWSLHAFPKSLCHGWGSGLVPLAQRWLLGIEPLAPGFAEVALHPAAPMPWAFEATVPTPHGPLRVSSDGRGAPLRYAVPDGVAARRLTE